MPVSTRLSIMRAFKSTTGPGSPWVHNVKIKTVSEREVFHKNNVPISNIYRIVLTMIPYSIKHKYLHKLTVYKVITLDILKSIYLERYMYIICKSCGILYKRLLHLWILMIIVGPEAKDITGRLHLFQHSWIIRAWKSCRYSASLKHASFVNYGVLEAFLQCLDFKHIYIHTHIYSI